MASLLMESTFGYSVLKEDEHENTFTRNTHFRKGKKDEKKINKLKQHERNLQILESVQNPSDVFFSLMIQLCHQASE